jgi:hypothetical protein
MAATVTLSTNRFSAASGGSDTKNEKRKDIWSSLLDSVATGKKLPEKNLIVLGRLASPFALLCWDPCAW